MTLTVRDLFVRVQVFVHIHGEVHHVCVAEEVQLSLKQFLFIVDLETREIRVIYKEQSICQQSRLIAIDIVSIRLTRLSNMDHRYQRKNQRPEKRKTMCHMNYIICRNWVVTKASFRTCLMGFQKCNGS